MLKKPYSLSLLLYAHMANKIRRQTELSELFIWRARQVVNELQRVAYSRRVQVQMDTNSQTFIQYSALVTTGSLTGQGDANCLSSFYTDLGPTISLGRRRYRGTDIRPPDRNKYERYYLTRRCALAYLLAYVNYGKLPCA